jgi:hypothetical protein
VHVTRDAGLNNLAALLNAAPLHLLPDRITTEAAYSAIMGCVRTAACLVYVVPTLVGWHYLHSNTACHDCIACHLFLGQVP